MEVGLDWNTIRLSPYDSRWQVLYAEEACLLSSILSAFNIVIEHVGSTAVHGMPAKPIIDMVAAIDSLEQIEDIVQILSDHGYRCLGECGRPGRFFFVKGAQTNTTHHLHLVKKGSAYFQQYILFRDYLRANPAQALEYAKHKIHLAKKHRDDRHSYRIEKGAYIENLLLLK